MSKRIFTSESVTEGHPDKICDQISDGVLDAILAKTRRRVWRGECARTTGLVLVMGEITTNCYVDIAGIRAIRLRRSAATTPNSVSTAAAARWLTACKQSEDIAMGGRLL